MHIAAQVQTMTPELARAMGLPFKSAEYFLDLVDDAGNWSGFPWFDGNVARGKATPGFVKRLVEAGLITSESSDGHAYCMFTVQGVRVAAEKLGYDLGYAYPEAVQAINDADNDAAAVATAAWLKERAATRVQKANASRSPIVGQSYTVVVEPDGIVRIWTDTCGTPTSAADRVLPSSSTVGVMLAAGLRHSTS